MGQGAVMSAGSGLKSCNRDTPTWNSAPPCSLSWTVKDNKAREEEKTVAVPVYADMERQRLIATLDVPFANDETADQWSRAGVALSLKD